MMINLIFAFIIGVLVGIIAEFCFLLILAVGMKKGERHDR